MDSLYIVIVGILFLLAVSDLIVGVSNDAVNFLNSAIGSKVASFKVIMFIAAIGVVVGATFSSGMMEVARKGIFHPEMFFFSEIMVIFFAVMITDVILLDAFNTFGLPTSTTVSIVFELLGAAVGISLLKVFGSSDIMVADYINNSKALAIVLGILLSVVVAFTVGALVQYVSRFIFSFRYKEKMKYFGSIWGGISITAITYFMLIKGLKGTSFANYELESGALLKDWVLNNTYSILFLSLGFWTILLQLLYWAFKVNISKIIVLVGTFALAMAFAGNDLVNFIGVPLAGFASYQDFIANPGADPDAMLMTGLSESVKTPYFFLLGAGLIMVLTLYFNKKAKRVIKTSIDLSRQDEGSERFGATIFSKVVVRAAVRLNKKVSAALPPRFNLYVRKQFDVSRADVVYMDDEKPAFDLIRAAVNLVVASILISFATSLKLPLSTTYVTFMVAMGTSLADNAWGRESAVYRITGVISVIMGWFVTAIVAFSVAFVVALLSKLGGIVAIVLFILGAAYSVIRSHMHGKKIETKKESEKVDERTIEKDFLTAEDLFVDSQSYSISALVIVSNIFFHITEGLISENRKELSNTLKKTKKFNSQVKNTKENLKFVIPKIEDESIESAQHFTLSLDALRELGNIIFHISNPAFEHVDNNHKPINTHQAKNLRELAALLESFCDKSKHIIIEKKFDEINDLNQNSASILSTMDKFVIEHIKRLRKTKSSAKNSKLFLDLISETKNLVLTTVSLTKTIRDLYQQVKAD
jgi:phosphate/sulfate permease